MMGGDARVRQRSGMFLEPYLRASNDQWLASLSSHDPTTTDQNSG